MTGDFQMQMISSRAVSLLETQSLATAEAREALFRDDTGRFLLYLSNSESSPTMRERVIILGAREALIWLNTPPQDERSPWSERHREAEYPTAGSDFYVHSCFGR
jgi:hypothetical protein